MEAEMTAMTAMSREMFERARAEYEAALASGVSRTRAERDVARAFGRQVARELWRQLSCERMAASAIRTSPLPPPPPLPPDDQSDQLQCTEEHCEAPAEPGDTLCERHRREREFRAWQAATAEALGAVAAAHGWEWRRSGYSCGGSSVYYTATRPLPRRPGEDDDLAEDVEVVEVRISDHPSHYLHEDYSLVWMEGDAVGEASGGDHRYSQVVARLSSPRDEE